MADRPTSYVAKTAPGHLSGAEPFVIEEKTMHRGRDIVEATAAYLRRLA